MGEQTIKAGVVGATGYTGVELLRLIVGHHNISLTVVTSGAEAGRRVSDIFPNLRGIIDLEYSPRESSALSECDVVFFATPNATAMLQAPALLEAGVKVIDLSADFRIKDPAIWRYWYGQEHACPELLDEAVYGLPEINRDELKSASLIANPGCYPTAIQLGFFPLLANRLVDTSSLIADAKSGVSGAGRNASMATQYCEVSDSFKAYSASGHRHLPEIKQGLNFVSETPVDLVFVPHLLPMIRGIESTLYASLKDSNVDIQSVYEEYYAHEQFIDVLPPGSHPDTRSVRAGNMVQLAVHRPEESNTVVILVVEDNLVKGAAGQAIQNMNIMFGIEETTGLLTPALSP